MALWLGVSDGMKMKVIYAISGIYSYRQGLMPFLVPFFLPEHLQPHVEDDKAICILSAWHPWPYLPLTISPLTSFKWGKTHFCVVQTIPGCVCCLLQLPVSALSLSKSLARQKRAMHSLTDSSQGSSPNWGCGWDFPSCRGFTRRAGWHQGVLRKEKGLLSGWSTVTTTRMIS